MRIIIPGASGFVGRNLITSLSDVWEVVALYRHSKDFPVFITRLQRENVLAIRCDLCDQEDVRRLVNTIGSGFDVCVYLAANSDPALSTRDPLADVRQNILGLVNFLSQVQLSRMIFFSSGAVYDGISGAVSPTIPVSPRLPYGIAKFAAESYVRYFTEKAGTVGSYVNVRFFGCYGPYEPHRKIYSHLVRSFALKRESRFVVRGDGRNLIDAMFVSDTISAIHSMISSDVGNLTLDLCTGNPISINELVRRAARIFGIEDLKIEHQGIVPEYIIFWASPDSVERLFGFKPTVDLPEGLQLLAEHLHREHMQD